MVRVFINNDDDDDDEKKARLTKSFAFFVRDVFTRQKQTVIKRTKTDSCKK